jgi:hypothetical protein
MSKYFEEIKDGIGSKPVDVSEKDIQVALSRKRTIDTLRSIINGIKAQIDKLVEECDHKVRYDEEAYMYDVRYCAGCGKHMGLI